MTAPRGVIAKSVAKLPPVPASAPTILGPVPVVRKTELRSPDGAECFGYWNPADRTVQIDSRLAPVAAWQTYWHEWAHAVLTDNGIELEEAMTERLCDALGTARTREMLDR